MSQYAPHRHDIILQNPDGQFIAVIGIKKFARSFTRFCNHSPAQYMTYTLLPQTPYFLLLSQDKGFLWKKAKQENPETPPNYQFSMDQLVTRVL